MLQIGSLVDNKYKILSEVGHGGMSVVYLAINERANKTWAVKEVRKDGVCDFEAVKQGLVVETDMLKRLNHPYLPSIIDVIDTEDSFLIVMDYIEGKSLQSVLKNSGAQPKENVRKWAMQLCDVLGYLHSREPAIIYRDMKPANVMLRPSGDITLIDFGTAREFKNRSMVEDTTCLGTRGYAAPEQFGGRGQTDARTDIYCLGATMYHLITGHSPAEPPYEIKPLSYWDPAYYGTGLEQIITRCCQQDPAHRYQSCAELMYDLEHMDDMDIVVQRKRKQKWAAFVSSVALFGVGLAGILGFSVAKSAAVTKSYDSMVNQAKEYRDFSSFVQYIDAAIKVAPGEYEAYNTLLLRIEEDGVFDTDSEWPAILTSLRNKTNDQQNVDHLLRSDREGYADIQYRIGKLYFLMAENNEENIMASAPFFENALSDERGRMSQSEDYDVQQKAQIAEALHTIASSISLLENTNHFTESEFTYKDLFDIFTTLVNENEIEGFGAVQYGIALYSRVAYTLNVNCQQINEAGTAPEDMMTLLDTLEQKLTTTRADLEQKGHQESFIEMIDNALSSVYTARNNASAIIHNKGK